MIFPQKLILTLILFVTVALANARAAEPETLQDPFEADLEENINSPAVSSKRRSAVKEMGDKVKSTLERLGFKTSKLREGEVVMVIIPCEQLFRANAFEISEEGKALLQKFRLPSEAAGNYKMLIAVHTDDTGDDSYADAITASRANALDDFLSAMYGDGLSVVVPYGIGRDEPLVSNDSVLNRAKNRRVEIYFVPAGSMVSPK